MAVSRAAGTCTPHGHDAPVALQGVGNHLQRRAGLLLDVLHAVGYILRVEEGRNAVINAGA